MDKKYIEENEIEIKYLRNHLTAEELEEFEVYLMENPELVEKLESDAVFLEDMDKAGSRTLKQHTVKAFLDNLSSIPIAVSFASFALGVVLTFGLLINISSKPGSAQIVYLSETRSSGDEKLPSAMFDFPEKSFGIWSRDLFILSVDANLLPNQYYEVSIYRNRYYLENAPLRQLSGFRTRSDVIGALNIVQYSNKYEPGDYILSIAHASDEKETRYLFTIK